METPTISIETVKAGLQKMELKQVSATVTAIAKRRKKNPETFLTSKNLSYSEYCAKIAEFLVKPENGEILAKVKHHF